MEGPLGQGALNRLALQGKAGGPSLGAASGSETQGTGGRQHQRWVSERALWQPGEKGTSAQSLSEGG